MLFETALGRFKQLVPDYVVSTSASAVLNRWYKKHANDGSIIDVDNSPFKSIYTVPKTGLRFSMPIKHADVDDQARLLKQYSDVYMGRVMDMGF